MSIPNEDHLRTVYDSMLRGNPYTDEDDDDDDDFCPHGVPFDDHCEECDEEDEEGS